MNSNNIRRWLSNFIVSAVIVFIVLEAFEYVVFGEIFYFSSALAGVVLPTAIVYSLLLGIVFGTAQFVLNPSTGSAKSATSTSMRKSVSKPKRTSKKSKKRSGKKKKRKKRKRK